MNKKKNSLPFDKSGGVITVQRRMLACDNYLSLTPQSKVLMMLMQIHWNNFKPVDYGVREAALKIPCAFDTARKAFNQLQKQGFIKMIDHSVFSSRVDSKSRTWRLTWLPFNSKKPTNDWGMWGNKINSTDLKTMPLESHRPKNDASGGIKRTH
ncbi:MAG: hypothetical protein KZQ83_00480 [gamma proteobacterium symbiont of Taylorina sp.]|nr:hypothetical protein [gamma proteobacterium symbiont of Taylorina sp.]